MVMHELRAEARIPVVQRGALGAGSEWFTCMVLDMSHNGFLMVANRQLEVGQLFDFRCELYPGRFLECMIEVRHADNDSAGAMITEIDKPTMNLLHAYLEEKCAERLDDPRRPAFRRGN